MADINYGYGTGLSDNNSVDGYFYCVYSAADTPETFDGAGWVDTIKIYNATTDGRFRLWKGTFVGETFVFDDYEEIVDISGLSTGWITLTAPADFTAFEVTSATGLGFYSASDNADGLILGGGTGVGNMNYGYNSADPDYSSSLALSDGTSRRLEIKVEGPFSISSSSSSSSSSQSSSSSSSSQSSSSSSSSLSSSSSSSSSATPGSYVWGHDTAVDEDYAEDLSTWSGSGLTSGSGDSEILTLDLSEDMESPARYLGALTAYIAIDKYQTGSGPLPTIQYKTGATRVACEADSWNAYNGTSFECAGWAKIKVTH
jgi:hypothetical protein